LLDKTLKEAHSVDGAVANSHNLHSIITDRLLKYTDLKEELIRIWQLEISYTVPLVISTAGIIPNRFRERLKFRDLRPAVHILIQKALTLNT